MKERKHKMKIAKKKKPEVVGVNLIGEKKWFFSKTQRFQTRRTVLVEVIVHVFVAMLKIRLGENERSVHFLMEV